ncbi:MAG: transposase [Sphingobacteriia bacterium]|nr:transposase [Sphingobacteriia bacterium]
MATKYFSQLSLADHFQECRNFFESDTPTFFALLKEHINLSDFIPNSFYSAFYKSLGRNRDYPLHGFLTALILQKIFSIPTDSLLIILLHLSKELREFCGFSKVPDATKFTRFKQDFLPYLEQMFHSLVDYTDPICMAIDVTLASTITFDTTGIELYVKENNPKTLNSLIKRLKTYYKDKPEVDPHKMAYGLMPSQAESSSYAKQLYINGHFCYADKLAIITNGLGIIRHIAFTDDDEFKSKHPDLEVEKKTDSPDQDKSIGDSSALIPVLEDFFLAHPTFHPHTFLGDSAFDSIEIYSALKDSFHFSKALIPYNPRNENTLIPVGYNEYGYPTCPNNPALPMKYQGICRERGRADRYKWGCPEMSYKKGQWVCNCKEPCSTAVKGRTTYTYENMDFRRFPGIQRDSEEWTATYKVRVVVEKGINHLKTNMCVAGRKSRNHLTTKADVYIAGIASQFTVILASRLNYPQYIRSLKPLIA